MSEWTSTKELDTVRSNLFCMKKMKIHQHWIFRKLGKPAPKIFIIGFNKCGTKTINRFFRRNGILSAHHGYHHFLRRTSYNIAARMKKNLEAGLPILSDMSRYEAFSDLIHLTDKEVIEANEYFKELNSEYPDAYFIFNDRPVDAWIKSRLNHEGGPGGSFKGRYRSFTGMTEAEVTALWKQQYETQKAAVLDYFSGNDRFIYFDITRDGPEELSEALSDDYKLNPAKWSHRGSAAERQKRFGKK
ncbi:sulfotransferase [Solemya velum gill symbiont]|uniref:sulfotransferase n=1 Tax=Solemya velum gill symbiont TaxID=2340 RepID=UPI00117A34BE|nr:sulfotransferase [Solemya velum gill symbiont]